MVEAFDSEVTRRKRAIDLVEAGVPSAIRTGGLVTATITTHNLQLTIGHRGDIAATFP